MTDMRTIHLVFEPDGDGGQTLVFATADERAAARAAAVLGVICEPTVQHVDVDAEPIDDFVARYSDYIRDGADDTEALGDPEAAQRTRQQLDAAL